MGVTTAFVSALVIGLPLLIAFIFSMIVWRCRLKHRRKQEWQQPQSVECASRNDREKSYLQTEHVASSNSDAISSHLVPESHLMSCSDIQLINSLSRTEPDQRVVRHALNSRRSRESSPETREIGYA